MAKTTADEPSVLPTDQFDQQFARLTGLPNGAQTAPAVVQDADWYGKVTSWMVQTVKHDNGETVFLTCISAAGSARFVLPPKVLTVIDRQRASTVTQVRRRHGRRIAAERKAAGIEPGFMKGKTKAAKA